MAGLLLLAWAVLVMHSGVAGPGMGHGSSSMSMSDSQSDSDAVSVSVSVSTASSAEEACSHPGQPSPNVPHSAMAIDSCLTTPAVSSIDHTPIQALTVVCFVAPRPRSLTSSGCGPRAVHRQRAPDPVTDLGVNRT